MVCSIRQSEARSQWATSQRTVPRPSEQVVLATQSDRGTKMCVRPRARPGHDVGVGGCAGAGAGGCGGACAGKGAADHAPTATYQNRRGELLHYFDRTAVDAWK